MKDMKIQEQGNVNLKLKNKKKQKLKEKGITLIALVVTIIILLILAGVTLNMALSGDGLFSKARNAADKYKKAQEDEAELISEIGKEMNNEYVGAYVTGYNPTEGGTLTITAEQSGLTNNLDGKGAIIEGVKEDGSQTFTTPDVKNLQWRIWDYDGTILRIILDKPTTQTIKLKGVEGYNNGVWVVNEICRQCFGNDGVEVANLKRSDIEKVSTYDYTKYKRKSVGATEVVGDDDDKSLIYYGEEKNYTEDCVSPKMWNSHDSLWNYKYDKDTKASSGDASCEYPWEQEYGNLTEKGTVEMKGNTTFKQSYYLHEYKKSEFKNEKHYDMIYSSVNENNKKGYVLSGRFSYLNDTICSFRTKLFWTS